MFGNFDWLLNASCGFVSISLTRVAFVYNGPKGTHIIAEVAKTLGGSFKLVTLAPRTVREMTQLLRGVFLANHLASNDQYIKRGPNKQQQTC